MTRTLSGIANTGLFVLCCFLVADTANAFFSALLTPPAETAAAVPGGPTPAARSWSERETILTRNLFNASVLAPAAPAAPEPVDLEATRLPLRLLGTAAASDPAYSWAAVEDTQERETEVVRVGSQLEKRGAEVVRIERKRIVLSENGVHRELLIGDDAVLPSRGAPLAARAAPRARTARVARTPNRRGAARRERRDVGENLRQLSDDRFAVSREDVEQLARDPAALLAQATILPKFENGQMVGVQLRGIKPGSLFERVGLQNDDVIVEFNGTPIDGPEESARVLSEFSEADEFDVVLQGGRTLHFVYE